MGAMTGLSPLSSLPSQDSSFFRPLPLLLFSCFCLSCLSFAPQEVADAMSRCVLSFLLSPLFDTQRYSSPHTTNLCAFSLRFWQGRSVFTFGFCLVSGWEGQWRVSRGGREDKVTMRLKI